MVEQIVHYADFATADVLLSVFFFVIGLELVEEFKNGELRDLKHAALPALAACGGVIMPAVIYVGVVAISGLDPHFLRGWAIPTATDVAFSLAVLAIFGTKLKRGTKLFLMVLAVVDDVIGIVIIAVAFSSDINAFALLGVVMLVFAWGYAVRPKKVLWPLVILLGCGVWVCMFLAGVHPTIAGVILGVTVPAKKADLSEDDAELIQRGAKPDTRRSRANLWSEKLSPISNKVVVPVFAATSLLISGYELLKGFSGSHDGESAEALTLDKVMLNQHSLIILAVAITVALLVGKPLGILLFAWIGQHLTPLKLFHGLRVRNLIGTTCLGGIGFTVSFLVASLSFENPTIVAVARVGVLVGSILSALLGMLVLKLEVMHYSKRAGNKTADKTADKADKTADRPQV